MKNQAEITLPLILEGIASCRHCAVGNQVERGLRLAGQGALARVLENLIAILFPGCHGYEDLAQGNLEDAIARRLRQAAADIERQITHALAINTEDGPGPAASKDRGRRLADRFVAALPGVQQALQRDIAAAYDGDPAAGSPMEVVLSYPGFKAIAAHRIAHVLHGLEVPLLPRMMSEYSHSLTGIDIHPGARIGEAFFIDHGTGVVIGETCVIGDRVRVYQGVTLGALSFPKDDSGKLVKGIKRHPNVEDEVIIYGGATILGDVTLGKGSVIGGNVWLTHSVPPYSKVYNQQPAPLVRQADGLWKKAGGPWNDIGGGI